MKRKISTLSIFMLAILTTIVMSTSALAVCEIGDVTFPNGADYLSGNTTVTWTWVNASECGAAVASVSHRINDTGPYTLIGNAVPGGTSLPWNTATVTDSSLYKLLVDIASDSDETDNFFTVDNTNPLAEANGPYTCVESGSITLNSTNSSDATSGINSTDWDLDDNGSYETNGASPLYNCGANGVYNVHVQITDNANNTANDSATVNVTNAPPVVNVTYPNGGEYLRGTVNITYNATDAYDNLTINISYSTDGGASYTPIATNVANEGNFTWDASSLNNLSVLINVTADDGDVNSDDTSDGAFTLDNVNPVADAGYDGSIAENESIALDASNTTEVFGNVSLLSLAWDFDADGQFDDANGTTPTFNPSSMGLNATVDGSYLLNLQVTDGAGNTHTDNLTMTVTNVAPVVAVTYPNGGESLYGVFDVNWTATDVVDNLTIDLEYTLDGASYMLIAANTTNDGQYSWNTSGIDSTNVTVRATAYDGTTSTQDSSDAVFQIDSVAPYAQINGPYACNEGSTVTLNSSGSDASTAGLNSTDWDLDDNGSFETNGASPVYTCVDDGVYNISLQITDNNTQTGTNSSNVTVSNVAPVVVAGLNQSVNEGDVVVLTSNWTDAGASDTHNVTVYWGDGSNSVLGTTTSPLNVNHTYADNGHYTVTIDVQDDDGALSSDTLNVSVANVAPAITPGADQSLLEGVTAALNASFTDNGSADTHNVTIDWGDGNVDVLGTVTSPLTNQHNYSNDGSYSVQIDVQDDDGALSTANLTINVTNVAPDVNLTAPTGGETLNGNVQINWSAYDPAPADNPLSIVVELSSDGGASYTVIGTDPANTGNFTWDTTSVADGNTYVIRINASDDDTTTSDASLNFTVDNTASASVGPQASPTPVTAGFPVTFTGVINDSFNVAAANVTITRNGTFFATYSMDASDGAFDSTEELVNVTVDTTGWPVGNYEFSVLGEDGSGTIEVPAPDNTDTFVVQSASLYYTKPEVDSIVSGNLSFYYNQTEIDNILANYYNKTETYNKSEVDALITNLNATYYNKTQIDTLFSFYYNSSQVDALLAQYYNMTQIDAMFATVYNKSQVDDIVAQNLSLYYNSSEVDNILGNYYNRTETYNKSELYNKSEIDSLLGGLSATYYNKTEIDNLFAQYYNQTQIDAMFAAVYSKVQVDSIVSGNLSAYYNMTEVQNILANYYNKTETYNRTEVDALITGLGATYYNTTQIDALFANYYNSTQIDAMFAFRIISSTPSGVLSNGTVTLTIGTSQNATCKYSTSAFDFGAGGTAMSGAGSAAHTASIGTLNDGTYTYVVACQDASTSVITPYFPVSFEVDTAGNFNYVQDLNLNWNALFLPNPTIIFGPTGSGYWGLNSSDTLKTIFDGAGIAGNYNIVWYFDTNTSTWKSFTDDGNGLNDDLTTVNNRNDQPYWVRMTSSDRFEVSP